MRTSAGASVGVASLFALVSCLMTCTGATQTDVAVTAVVPPQAFNDEDVDVVIQGGPFLAAYDIDTGNGRAVTQLGAFTAFLSPTARDAPLQPIAKLTWLSTSELAARIPSHTPRGSYDVQVRDPRGGIGYRVGAFTSLGPDEKAPDVRIAEPEAGAIVVGGAEVPVAFVADDFQGQVGEMTWTVKDARGTTFKSGSCTVEPGVSRETCRFVFIAPAPAQAESATITVAVRDHVGNPASAAATVTVALPPTVKDVVPREGAASGATDVVVTGDAFVPGTQVLIGDALLEPSGGSYVSARELRGHTSVHEPGVFPVVVRSGSAEVKAGVFEFVGRPVVFQIAPMTGPPAGNVPIILAGKYFRSRARGVETRVELGPKDGARVVLGCLEVVSENRITGIVPPGVGVVSIFASDPVGGSSELPLAFTYLDDDGADAGPPTPCLKTGEPL